MFKNFHAETFNIMNPILKLYNSINEYGKHHNIHFNVINPGQIEYFMKIQSKDLSQPFAAHGGAIAGFMDAILGVTALSLSVESFNLVSTVEFKINYLNPAILEDELLGTGEVIKNGKSLIFAEGKIQSITRNIIIATGSGTFNKYAFDNSPLKDLL